jgi:hypothetical protein
MAARYWVGGTATWDATAGTKWALTSGGAGGQTVPGATDDVFFTAASGAVTCTWSATSPTVLSINCTGFTGTLATGGNSKTLAGTTTLWTSPVTCTITGAPTLTASSTAAGTRTVTCNHASPSAANSINFTFALGSHTVALSGGGFRNLSITFPGIITGFVSVYGNVTLGPTGTSTSFSPTFLATATYSGAGRTISSATVNAPGATVTTSGAMTLGAANTFTLTAGTLSLGGTLSAGSFSSSNTNTRAIAFGANNIALTSTTSSALVLDMDQATGFTWTGTGGFTRNQAATATIFFGSAAGGTTTNAPNFTVNAGASTLSINFGSWFKNLIFTGSTCTVSGTVNIAGNLTLATGGTYTAVVPTFLASATITSAGKTLGNTTINGSGITVTLANAMTVGTSSTTTLTQGTLALAGFTLSTGIFSSSNSNTRAISFSTGNIALTSTTAATTVLSMADATNFTFTGTGGFTRNQAATATMVFGTTGGTTSNAPNLTVNAGASAFAITSGSYFKNVIFTGSTSTVTASNLNMGGNLTLASGGAYNAILPTFRASATITSVSKILASTTINGSGITVTLADAMRLTSVSTLTLTEGGFAAAGFDVTASSFSSSNTNTRTLDMGSGTWTISGSGATAWNTATTTGLTVAPSTSTITMTSASAKTFAGGGLTYYNLNQGGAGALTISGSNTFNDITDTVQPSTVTFTAGTTQTVSNFSLAGTAGNLVTINSATPGSQFTLSKSSGTVNAQYLAIQDSNATGGATWNALFSTNLGNNTGWIFPGGNMFLMFM